MNLKRLSKISDNICIRCSAHLDYDQEVYDRNPEMRCKCKDDKPFTGKDALDLIDWLRQTIHRTYHKGPLDECEVCSCEAALKALGKR